MDPLSAAYRVAFPDGTPADAALEERLARVVAGAGAAWPGLAVEPVRFAAVLGEAAARAAVDPEVLHAGDLWLCAAVLAGDPDAGAAFVAHVSGDVRGVIARLGVAGAEADELAQRVLERLLVSDGAVPRLAGYRGTGPVRAWVKVVATRVTTDWLRLRRPERPSDDGELAVAATAGDPELAYMKELYRAEVVRAFGEAMAALTPRQRNLLRHHHLRGLSIDQLAMLYGAHRATCARWLARAREELLAGVQRAVAHQLRLDRGGVESILRLVASHLDVSLGSHDRLEDDA